MARVWANRKRGHGRRVRSGWTPVKSTSRVQPRGWRGAVKLGLSGHRPATNVDGLDVG
jgi:hypothetical protein